MADIFLSYVRQDKAPVAPIVAALRSNGFGVWWDDDIAADAPWEGAIEQALQDARIVVVCELIDALRACMLDGGRFKDARVLRDTGQPDSAGRPVSLFTLGVKAGETRAPGDLARARARALVVVSDMAYDRQSAIQWLSQRGFVDDAFAVAAGYRPGYPMTSIGGFLFDPRTAALRRDPRFLKLAADYGLLAFWRTSGKWPDFCADPALPYRCR